VNYQSKNGKTVSVNLCGLSVNPSMPWLAASPDGIVIDQWRSTINKAA